MSKSVLIGGCMLLAFTGCYTPLPKKNTTPITDWSDPSSPTNRVVPAPATNAPSPPAATLPTPLPTRTSTEYAWQPLGRWAAEKGLRAPLRVASGPTNSFALVSPTGIFALQAGSTTAIWNGVELRLGFKPQLTPIQGELLVHNLDLEKNLAPLLLPAPVNDRVSVVVIDAGHGGPNLGTCSPDGNCEKTFALDWALRLASLLRTNGWTVHLTRTNDVELSLAARVAFADEQNADLFISLHFNHSGGGPEPAGVETYCLTPVGMESTLTRGYPDDPNEVLPNNTFDAENLRLAAQIHRELLRLESVRDRGIRRARFQTVLRGQNRPAVLIEGGFLSNTSEARRIADPEYRQRLAEAVARALGS